MYKFSLFYLLLGKYFFILGMLFLIDILAVIIKQFRHQPLFVSQGQKILFVFKVLGTIPFFFGYLLFVFFSDDPSFLKICWIVSSTFLCCLRRPLLSDLSAAKRYENKKSRNFCHHPPIRSRVIPFFSGFFLSHSLLQAASCSSA